jgi:hypothetical protein
MLGRASGTADFGFFTEGNEGNEDVVQKPNPLFSVLLVTLVGFCENGCVRAAFGGK